MNLRPDTVAAITVAGIVVYVLLKREAKAAAETIGQAVNPTDPENIFYSGVSSVGRAVTGDDNWTLGAWIYDVMNNGGPD